MKDCFNEVCYSNVRLPKQNGHYQSNLKVKDTKETVFLTIFGNQPVDPSENKKTFELVSKDLAEILGYLPFKYEKIIYQDTPSKSFNDKLEKILNNLKNI